MKRSLAAVGDVASPACWSGTPWHFLRASLEAGFLTDPVRIDPGALGWSRRIWNLKRMLRGSGKGGYQYSASFLAAVESQVPPELWEGEILTMNQHFPRSAKVLAKGGRISHYLDAPFAAMVAGRGLGLALPAAIVREAIETERENYAASERVVMMARWAAEAAVAEGVVTAEKAHVILPGANLDLPEEWDFPERTGGAGRDREFTLGFVGKDWKRKGLPLVVAVRDELERRGWKARVLVIGEAPAELRRARGLVHAGYVDKAREGERFLGLLSSCDLGCLFSEREALGISTLEFLRAGVPVAGFDHEGMADTIPADAGFLFPNGSKAEGIADRLEEYLRNEADQATYSARARKWSGLVTWERCVKEFQELWETGRVAAPVQPWKGMAG